jgi:hypothetical protein
VSFRKIAWTLAAGAATLGAVIFTKARSHDPAAAPPKPDKGWTRSATLAEGVSRPLEVLVEGEYAYFVGGGYAKATNAVYRVKSSGGPLEVLSTLDAAVAGPLAVDAERVYATSEEAGIVYSIPKSGGKAEPLAHVPLVRELAVDATHIYFSTGGGNPKLGTIGRLAKSGGPPDLLLSAHPGIDGLVLSGDEIYFRSNLGLFALPKSGGTPRVLYATANHQNVIRLASDGTHLYFFFEAEPQSGHYKPARMPKSGGVPEVLGPDVALSRRIALSDTHVYFFRKAGLTSDVLVRLPKSGGEPETVDGAGHSSGYLTVAGGDVYFTDISRLYRVPK